MKKFISILTLISILSCCLILTGCLQKKVEEPTLSVSSCIKDSGFKKSEKGSSLLYYYATPTEVSVYSCENWKSGRISLKRYFVDKSTYELEKSLAKNVSNSDDKKLTFLTREYMVISDMDAYWDEIEASSVYKIVK